MAICILQSPRVTVTRDLSVTKLKSCVCLVVAWLAYKRVTCDFPHALNRHEQQTWEARRRLLGQFLNSIVSTSKITPRTSSARRSRNVACRLSWSVERRRGVTSHPVVVRCGACMPRGVVGRAAEDGRTAAVETL